MPDAALSVCVYCGSRNGARPGYVSAAQETGQMLARNGWRLIYGAGDVGLMGHVARAAEAEAGETFGVIPTHLLAREVGRHSGTRMVITETMHERKKVMFMNADAVAMLPGGAGSLDEFFEVLTWRQLGLHAKPIYLLNIEGFWDPLIGLLDHIVAEEFAGSDLRGYVAPVRTVADLEAALKADI